MFRRLSRSAFYVGLLLVVTLSVLPHETLPPVDVWDKAGHAAAYGLLALVGGLGFPGRRALCLVALGLVLLGAGLELIQSVVPSREASAEDLLANAIGILFGSLCAVLANSMGLSAPGSDGQ